MEDNIFKVKSVVIFSLKIKTLKFQNITLDFWQWNSDRYKNFSKYCI